MCDVSRRNLLKSSIALSVLAAGAAYATPSKAPVKWDKSYDMVIIGAGGGGLMAAHYAAQVGLTAVVLEQMLFPGGSISVADTPYQRAKGVKDSNERFVQEMLRVGKNVNDPALVEAHVKNVKAVFNFIDNDLKVKAKSISAVSGMSVPRAHSYFPPSNLIQHLFDYVTKTQHVPVEFNTAAKRLV